jgi:hypothetical protein
LLAVVLVEMVLEVQVAAVQADIDVQFREKVLVEEDLRNRKQQ